MNYVDGFVAAVPTANKQAYQRHCQEMGAVFKEHGALAVVDCWGDDVPEGKLTSFTMAVKREPDEAAVFGWIVWPSREVRDAGWAAVMADPRMEDQAMPFDGKRMIYGGFQTIAQS
jgi:uncharacterized protein YbaA (DUF1428 family)